MTLYCYQGNRSFLPARTLDLLGQELRGLSHLKGGPSLGLQDPLCGHREGLGEALAHQPTRSASEHPPPCSPWAHT